VIYNIQYIDNKVYTAKD